MESLRHFMESPLTFRIWPNRPGGFKKRSGYCKIQPGDFKKRPGEFDNSQDIAKSTGIQPKSTRIVENIARRVRQAVRIFPHVIVQEASTCRIFQNVDREVVQTLME